MTRLARRNKVRWHKQMKRRGFVWMKRAWWKNYQWEFTVWRAMS